LEDKDKDGKIILTWMSKKEGGTIRTRSSGLEEGRVMRLAYRYKSSGSKKSKEFIDYYKLKEGNRFLGRLHIGFRLILI
jgi:hypothetical protein